jgi:hypothetical protein
MTTPTKAERERYKTAQREYAKRTGYKPSDRFKMGPVVIVERGDKQKKEKA